MAKSPVPAAAVAAPVVCAVDGKLVPNVKPVADVLVAAVPPPAS